GRRAQPLEAAVVALDGDRDRERLEAREHDARRDHAGQEVLRERHGVVAGALVPAVERRAEDREHDERGREDEDDGAALAEERAELGARALDAEAAGPGQGGRARGTEGRGCGHGRASSGTTARGPSGVRASAGAGRGGAAGSGPAPAAGSPTSPTSTAPWLGAPASSPGT